VPKPEQRYTITVRGRKVIVFDRRTGMHRELTSRQMTRNQAGYDERTAELPGYVRELFWRVWNEGQEKGWPSQGFTPAHEMPKGY
jgi:hypothetical protein